MSEDKALQQLKHFFYLTGIGQRIHSGGNGHNVFVLLAGGGIWGALYTNCIIRNIFWKQAALDGMSKLSKSLCHLDLTETIWHGERKELRYL